MRISKAEKLIVKFLTNQASAQELDELSKWIEDSRNQELFTIYVKTNYAIDYNMKKFEANKVKKELQELIDNEKKVIRLKKYNTFTRYVAAVLIIGLMASAYIFRDSIFNNPKENSSPTIVNTAIIPGTDKATLTLEDGSQVVLEKDKPIQTQNASSNGKELVYHSGKSKSKDVAYNYLTIPRGGQFFIKLSDGTQVWLNSESQLKYPVNFMEGEERKIELVYGEAYFDVSPSSEHKGSHFKVFNQSQEVNVIGTEFNIKAYQDERNIYTTLVEGKVDVSIQSQKHSLRPNQQLNLDIETKTSRITMVDVYNEISWKDGVFSFENKSLKEMMTVLSRWYDVEVIIKNKSIETQEFIGILRKNQNIEEILTSIKNFGVIKNFTVADKKVILE